MYLKTLKALLILGLNLPFLAACDAPKENTAAPTASNAASGADMEQTPQMYTLPTLPVPIRPGEVLDPNSEYVKKWPGKARLAKKNDSLILAIPPNHGWFWIWPEDVRRERTNLQSVDLNKLELTAFEGIWFILPNMDGFRSEHITDEKMARKNSVLINYLGAEPMTTMEPGAAGSYPPNVIERRKKDSEGPSKEFYKPVTKYEMNCIQKIEAKGDKYMFCFGSDVEGNAFFLQTAVEPYSQEDFVRVNYSTPKYGGLELSYMYDINYLKDWKLIDAKIWQYIDSWNVVK
jgi:hypothetical protein